MIYVIVGIIALLGGFGIGVMIWEIVQYRKEGKL